ncbi:alpha/beta fold hydrolase [Kitasatospora acidiphila]|uniref:Alpha/beta fold hydrolase n=1 Tax=Kitasatospora acidiphila TaxID=2567942 RepID=A0A540W5G0_9ACTN|nr:alpha/beta fold hydrolase [Kitasatospora acidiphila]TQF04265.1 alpha/beta fold hydrolase [Kitasatospora acidiphila]
MRLRWKVRSAGARAVVLVLHGGREADLAPARPWQPAAVRMAPFLRPLRRATAGGAVAVGLVRYRHRGWNGDRADAAQDVLAALDAVAAECGPVPVVLLGHSMGGRAALRAAGHRAVTGVVALAPWCPPDDPCEQLAGRTLVTLHGDLDRVTDPAATLAFAARARAAGAAVAGIGVAGGDHAMLRRHRDWHRGAAGLVAALLGLRPLPGPVAEALAARGADQTGLAIPLPRSRP